MGLPIMAAEAILLLYESPTSRKGNIRRYDCGFYILATSIDRRDMLVLLRWGYSLSHQ